MRTAFQVARGVHALVGGEVDHATPDAAPLGDDTKMMRRLLALNLMGREGWAPDLELWKVRHAYVLFPLGQGQPHDRRRPQGTGCRDAQANHMCNKHTVWLGAHQPQLPQLRVLAVAAASHAAHTRSMTRYMLC
jgi:hypothetical protein